MSEEAPAGRFSENVAYFGRALRAAGLPVGPGDVLDAVAAVAAAGIGERADLHSVLHAVFVRRREHAAIFDQAFRLFWRRRDLAATPIARTSPPAPPAPKTPDRPEPGEARVLDALQPRRRDAEPETVEEVTARPTSSGHERLLTRDFAQMSAAEIGEARRLIAALRLPDDARPTRRLVPVRRAGRVDLRRSLRASLRNGGAAIDLAFRAPAMRPPPIVALVDVSGSMTEYSRLFLHFLHTLGERRRGTRGFVFATRLTNITRELRGRDPDEALARASARVLDWEGGTRIADALAAFNRHWSRRVLGGGATVLLFTDGLEREVGGDLAFEMDRLHRSCRRLVWLNPLLRFDAFEARAAGIQAMLPHVDAFRPIHSLDSMRALIRALDAISSGPSRKRSRLRPADTLSCD